MCFRLADISTSQRQLAEISDFNLPQLCCHHILTVKGAPICKDHPIVVFGEPQCAFFQLKLVSGNLHDRTI